MQMIPAYSPQARGRSERSFGTWQGRLPQELAAGRNRRRWKGPMRSSREPLHRGVQCQKFTVAARRKERLSHACSRTDLNWIFTVQTERVVAKDNTVTIGERVWQIDKNSLSQHAGRLHGDDPRAPGSDAFRFATDPTWWDDSTHQGRPSAGAQESARHERSPESACGSKELDSPPFPFPPPGASRGHTASAALGRVKAPAQKQSR